MCVKANPRRRADQVMFPVHDSTVSGDHDTDGAGTRRIVVRRFEVYRRKGAHRRLLKNERVGVI